MTTMTGKASGRCRGTEGVYGWFSPGFRGYVAAVSWRDGQTQRDPHERPRWAILERVDARWRVLRTWCLPPSMAELAATDPEWTPDVPFDLLTPEFRWAAIDAADAAGVPRPGPEPLIPRPVAKEPKARTARRRRAK